MSAGKEIFMQGTGNEAIIPIGKEVRTKALFVKFPTEPVALAAYLGHFQ